MATGITVAMIKPSIALCSAIAVASDGVPEWIHLLPAGEVRTMDGRGPYRCADADALMAASLSDGDKLVLDENHATDLAAPRGESAPARGWIVELQGRENGIWGRVEWTGEGRRLMEDRAYRGISPAIAHRKDGVVTQILRASLINAPNLKGLASLHQEGHVDMDWKVLLIEALGLDSGASDEAIAAALKKKVAGAGDETALQSELAPIAKAAGLAENADATAILAGVRTLASRGGSEAITALQSELATVTTQLNELRDNGARTAATAFVDSAIAAGRVGIKPLRDDYVAMHMEDSARTEKLINGMPILHGTRLVGQPQGGRADGELGDADQQVIALMGLDPEAYKKTLAASATSKEAL